MKLNLFSCPPGYLLSPDCMLAPLEAVHVYGPVSPLLGTLDCDELPAELCERIRTEVERRAFAFVPLNEGIEANIPGLVEFV